MALYKATPEGNVQLTPEEEAQILADWSEHDPNAVNVPESVSMRQARIALNNAGLLNAVNSAVAASTDNNVKIAWEFAADVKRNDPYVKQLASALLISDSQLDQLFIEAKTL